MAEVKVDCDACDAQGIEKGPVNADGVATMCDICKGKTYVLMNTHAGRKPLPPTVKVVQKKSYGRGTGAPRPRVTAAEFVDGKIPE